MCERIRYDSSQFGFGIDSFHSERLASSCLTVGEYCTVVSGQYFFNDRPGCFVVDVNLSKTTIFETDFKFSIYEKSTTKTETQGLCILNMQILRINVFNLFHSNISNLNTFFCIQQLAKNYSYDIILRNLYLSIFSSCAKTIKQIRQCRKDQCFS